jgi:hypothetical protein
MHDLETIKRRNASGAGEKLGRSNGNPGALMVRSYMDRDAVRSFLGRSVGPSDVPRYDDAEEMAQNIRAFDVVR